MFSVSFHSPNIVSLKSLSACIRTFLLVHLKREHLTSRPDVESFVDSVRGWPAVLMGQCDSPLGGYHGQSHACWWCQRMHNAWYSMGRFGIVSEQLMNGRCRIGYDSSQRHQWLSTGGAGLLFSFWDESVSSALDRNQMYVVLLSLNKIK